MLTYSLVYTPSSGWEVDVPKYLCSDNRIHIRLKDFNSPQIIRGFEAKLTYLISYLFHFCYHPNIVGNPDQKTLLKGFNESSYVQELYGVLITYVADRKFKGIKITPNYNKKRCTYFGEVDVNCFPFDRGEELKQRGHLKDFLHYLHDLSLIEYLFNDEIELYIHPEKQVKENKFIRKMKKKTSRYVESDRIELW